MDQYDAIWNDWWLKQYTTALIKLQWGMNMIKYEGIQLPSGIQLNGRQIYDDAVAEIAALEQALQETWQLPIDFFMG
jgi:Asp-tRNA(Asn)/Glu-tRNA(Gln) amidotransferase A subunit family amidase